MPCRPDRWLDALLVAGGRCRQAPTNLPMTSRICQAAIRRDDPRRVRTMLVDLAPTLGTDGGHSRLPVGGRRRSPPCPGRAPRKSTASWKNARLPVSAGAARHVWIAAAWTLCPIVLNLRGAFLGHSSRILRSLGQFLGGIGSATGSATVGATASSLRALVAEPSLMRASTG